jgi:ATP-binding cassette subfamily B protein
MAENHSNSRPPENRGPRGHGYQRPQNLWGTVKRLLKYLAKYRLLLVFVLFCLLLSSVGSIASSYMLKPVLNDYIIPGDFRGLAKVLVLMGGLFLLSAACSYTYARIMVHISQHTVAALRQDLFNKLQTLPLKYFDSHQSGDLMSRFTNDIDTVSELINSTLANLLSGTLTFVGTLTMMFILNWALTLITVFFLLMMGFVVKFVGGRSRVNFQRQQSRLGAVNGYIEEMIEGQKVIKVFNHERKAVEHFRELNVAYRDAATTAQSYAGSMMPAMANLRRINYAFTACIGGLLTLGGMLDIGSLGAYLVYLRQVSQPVAQVSQQVNVILAAVAGAERIFAVMEESPETDDGETVIVRVEKDGDVLTETSRRTGHWAWKRPDGSLVELRGDVRFHDVDFRYVEEKPVLQDVTLWAEPGQKIAFVGSTGAGKTTVTNLLNRFYDVQEGSIRIDGVDVRNIRRDVLRQNIAMVLQDTHLFTGTVMENIRYGKLDATDEECIRAAKIANADFFISHLPEGYNTMLVSDGANLSQGQRQLISIARAAVSDPPVLILDEATSSIDTRTEKLIEKGMDSLMKGRTVFVIAHRLSTVRNANCIMVLEHGEIIERGEHDDLLKQKGKYYQLYTGAFELT